MSSRPVGNLTLTGLFGVSKTTPKPPPSTPAVNESALLPSVDQSTGKQELYGALKGFARNLDLGDASTSPAARLMAHRRERIASVTIDDTMAHDLLDPLISAMSIGRSGFTKLQESRRYASFIAEFYQKFVFELRNQGYRPEELLAFLSSATAGIIDEISRTLGRSLGKDAINFMDDSLEPYIDPHDKTLQKVVHLGDQNYSRGSLAFSDIVLSFSGGAYALFNDIPEAVKRFKASGRGKIYLINFSGLPPFEKDFNTGNPYRISNNVKLLMDEYSELSNLIEKRLQRKYRHKFSPDEFWDPDFEYADDVAGIIRRRHQRYFRETDGNRSLYSYVLYQNINKEGPVLKNPQELWRYLQFVGGEYRPEEAIDELVADLIATFPEKFEKAELTPPSHGKYFSYNHDGSLQIAVTGRELHINYADSRQEMEAIFKTLGEALYLAGRDHDIGINDMGFVHGLRGGFDQLFLDAIVSSGYPSHGIIKENEEGHIQNAETAGYNLYSKVGKKEEDWIKAMLGYDRESRTYNTDVVIAFEGDTLSQKLIERAHRNHIPVIVVQTGTPANVISDIQNTITNQLLRAQVVSILLYLYKNERERALVGKEEDHSDGLIGSIIEARPENLPFNFDAGVQPGLISAQMAAQRMLRSLESYSEPDKEDIISEVSQFLHMVSLAITMMQSEIDVEAEQEKPEDERKIFVVQNGGELARILALIKERKNQD